MDTENVKYNNRYFRIMFCLIAGYSITMYNEPVGFFEAIFSQSYGFGFAGNFFLTIFLTEYIHYITLWLDRKFDWQKRTLERCSWQVIFGLGIPSVISFVIVGNVHLFNRPDCVIIESCR